LVAGGFPSSRERQKGQGLGDWVASDGEEKKMSGELPAPAATIVMEPVLAPVD